MTILPGVESIRNVPNTLLAVRMGQKTRLIDATTLETPFRRAYERTLVQRYRPGLNVLALGIYHETLLRWVPRPVSVQAQSQTFIAQRREPATGRMTAVAVPDSVQVLTEIEGGARGVYLMSGVVHHAPMSGFELYGSEGSIIYDVDKDEILVGKAKQASLRSMAISAERDR